MTQRILIAALLGGMMSIATADPLMISREDTIDRTFASDSETVRGESLSNPVFYR